MNPTEFPAEKLNRLQSTAMIMAVVGIVLSVIGALTEGNHFFHSYLNAYLFWFGVTAGSLGLLMLHHMVSGGWGFLLRRQFEAAIKLLPVMALLFIPVLLGLFNHYLYHWADPHASEDAILRMKSPYLNIPFFIARFVIYFVIWMGLAYFLNKWGNTQDERSDLRVMNRLNHLSAAGMLLLVLTNTFAMVDWLMSLTPHWFSSIIGLLFAGAHALSTLALMIVLFNFIWGDNPLVRQVPRRYYRDLGNLTMALVLLWAYLSFSQYLIIYSGNVAEEVEWYLERYRNGWGFISMALIPLHFALPFLVLLVGSRLKDDPRKLWKVALFLVIMRFVDLYWWVTPTFRHHLSIGVSDIGTPLAIGGVWLWLWARNLKGRPVLPMHDPRLEGEWPPHAAAHPPAQEVVHHG